MWQTSLLFLLLTGKASSHRFSSLPFPFISQFQRKMKHKPICFLVWDIFGILHMWNGKNIDWGFFPYASGRDFERLWADHKHLQPIQKMFTVNRISFISLDLSSYQEKQNMQGINNPITKCIFMGTCFLVCISGWGNHKHQTGCVLGEAVDSYEEQYRNKSEMWQCFYIL